MTARASVIMWSAGSGILLGLFIDAALIGIWTLASTAMPALSSRQLPKWAAALIVLLLAAVPIVTGLLGYLEGRLKVD